MYVTIYGTEERNSVGTTDSTSKKKKSAGMLEGVFLFIKHNYVKGIFAISCLFMVEVTIIDFTMKMLFIGSSFFRIVECFSKYFEFRFELKAASCLLFMF